MAVDAHATTEDALYGRFRDIHLSPAATDLAGRNFREQLKRVDPLSLAKGTVQRNSSFLLSDSFRSHSYSPIDHACERRHMILKGRAKD